MVVVARFILEREREREREIERDEIIVKSIKILGYKATVF